MEVKINQTFLTFIIDEEYITTNTITDAVMFYMVFFLSSTNLCKIYKMYKISEQLTNVESLYVVIACLKCATLFVGKFVIYSKKFYLKFDSF